MTSGTSSAVTFAAATNLLVSTVATADAAGATFIRGWTSANGATVSFAVNGVLTISATGVTVNYTAPGANSTLYITWAVYGRFS